ncbi:hypothetical protein WSM22_38430 [Cytophagales bacterium WSM2-2]|nr:hypothetical protein WSM22_38430 [Cytophagales bacterium WSM2-2]
MSTSGKSSPLYASSSDFPGVIRALKSLKTDITLVTEAEPQLITDKSPSEKEVVIVGTLGKNPLIDQLIQSKKIDVSSLTGKWEDFLIQTVEKPFPKVDRALVIVGSDKRGTIFGIYDLSKQIGVSPWYWWADVPVKKNKNVFVSSVRYVSGEPSVKYRGIFLNDEEPSLGRWAVEKYGGFKHELYEKIFELLLRLKGNYLWPAMWWPAFNADDPLNPELADEYGIVMGTSHHEPMMRAHAEWRKLKAGDWNYETNTAVLQKFWREGIERMGNRESIVTLAMRGDGDMAMSEDTKTALLEKIVKDQRGIIADVTKKNITQIPQLWAIYKEVQDYYDKGMRVPDDVTLLFCDDNWGNIRKLPALKDKARPGGYGIYYHFDYVGDPRNYKWLNTNPIAKVWEQMHMAKEYGADRIWIVNVGDLKPMEFPISFFLDYAWDTNKWNQNNLEEYTRQWCAEQFGEAYATDIADIISKYTKYNGRRKPELISPETFSQVNYHEAENVVADYRALEKRADDIYSKIPESQRDAFYQLVLYPVKACANLYDIYVTTGKNKLYADQGRVLTNMLADKVKKMYKEDSLLSAYYNKTLAGGKWNNMMNQIHFGYTYWQDPPKQLMPEVKQIVNGNEPEMGIAVEGLTESWPTSTSQAVLPEFNSYQKSEHYFEIFNRGPSEFNFSASADVKWIKLSKASGAIKNEERITVSVDWSSVPSGLSQSMVTISGPGGKKISIACKINNTKVTETGFIETDHYLSIEAEHFDKAVKTNDVQWQILPDYGRTLSGVVPFPVTASVQTPGGNSPHLEYNLLLVDSATIRVQLQLSPTLNYNGSKGLLLAVSLDDETPRVINIHRSETQKTWARSVEDNMRAINSTWKITKPGKHILKYWMIDPGIVLQKIIIDAGGLKPSYLGPPESIHIPTLINTK